jgi:hypothetical protein
VAGKGIACVSTCGGEEGNSNNSKKAFWFMEQETNKILRLKSKMRIKRERKKVTVPEAIVSI